MTIFMFPLMASSVAYLFIPFLARPEGLYHYEYLETASAWKPPVCLGVVSAATRLAHGNCHLAIALALQQLSMAGLGLRNPSWAALDDALHRFRRHEGVALDRRYAVLRLMGGVVVMAAVVLWSFNGDVLHIWRVAGTPAIRRCSPPRSTSLTRDFWKEMTIWGLFVGRWSTRSGPTAAIRFWCKLLAAGSRAG